MTRAELLRRARALGLDRDVDRMLLALVEQYDQAERSYVDTHWGVEPGELIEATAASPKRGEVLPALGELVQVVYRTQKAEDFADWEHTFIAPRPLLAYSGDGRLVVAGGAYQVTQRGIEG